MRYWKSFLAIFLAAILMSGCGASAEPETASPETSPDVPFTDALGYEVRLSSWNRVVSLYGSFAEVWMLSGGTLAGTTSDALEERQLDAGPDAVVVGSVKEPNLEEILAADPDFVILAADIAAQADLHNALTEAGIPHAYYRTDTFQEYLAMLRQLCSLTGREDLYEENGLAVQREIARVEKLVQGRPHPTALLLRAYSSGVKAKGNDNLAGVILRDLGGDNLVSRHESLLEDLSLEEVIAADPDFLLVTTMGSEAAAAGYLKETVESNPAWAGLRAVQSGQYVLLPQELFHYKPNVRWGESYAYLAKILYPDLAAQLS